ncbi:uncharacterized protein METZ01_LOCUS209161, partial [marine metagenome]
VELVIRNLMWVVEVSVANAVGLQQRLVETSVFVQRKD